MSLRSLNDWEVALIKAFCETDLNDQQILAYFTRPSRTVNHRVISGIRAGRYFSDHPVSTEEDLAQFKERWHRLSVSKGKVKEIEELIAKSREAMISAIQSYNNPRVSFRSEIFIVLSMIAWTYLLHATTVNRTFDTSICKLTGRWNELLQGNRNFGISQSA